MSRKITIPPKEELQSAYFKFGQTISTLAKRFNTSNPTVRKWLVHYDIVRKSHKQASQEANTRDRSPKPTKEELETFYKSHSMVQTTKHFKIAQATLTQWLFDDNISRTSHQEACSKRIYKFHKRSTQEVELENFCRSLSPTDDWKVNDRTLIAPQELDLVNHTQKLAIEYCGVYWHTEYFGKKIRDYHYNKMQLCRSKGYELLTIFDTDPEESVKSLIRYKLKHTTTRIGARLCIVKEITHQEAKNFHRQYHRARYCSGGKVHIGLFHKDQLLQVMTLGHNRFSKHYEWELLRMTNGSDVAVSGGLSKLWTFFITHYKPLSVVSYADLRSGNGNGYLKLGFIFTHYTKPNYWYYKAGETILHSRVMFQKHKLPSKLQIFDSTKTEWQNMLVNGYDRIWDCGNAVYVWKSTK